MLTYKEIAYAKSFSYYHKLTNWWELFRKNNNNNIYIYIYIYIALLETKIQLDMQVCRSEDTNTYTQHSKNNT